MLPAHQNPLRTQSANPIDDPSILERDESKLGLERASLSDEDLHDDEETGLTTKDKTRKQKKRRRNTLLDQRIVKGDKGIPNNEKKEADKSVARRLLINATLIGLWYIFSLSISLVKN